LVVGFEDHGGFLEAPIASWAAGFLECGDGARSPVCLP